MEQVRYVLVTWPECQEFMEHPRFSDECYLLQASSYQQPIDSAYFIPEDIYNEVFYANPLQHTDNSQTR